MAWVLLGTVKHLYTYTNKKVRACTHIRTKRLEHHNPILQFVELIQSNTEYVLFKDYV